MSAVQIVSSLSYILASCLFIFGLKMLSSPATARRGNVVSAIGMLIAVVATLVGGGIISYQWILLGAALGTIIGAVCALCASP